MWPIPAEEADAIMTREGISGQNSGTELTKINPMEPRPENQNLWPAKGQATLMKTVTKTGPRLKAGCLPGIGQCQGVSVWTMQILGSRVAKSTRIECKGFLKKLLEAWLSEI